MTVSPDHLRDALRRLVHAASVGLFCGILVLGLGYLCAGMLIPLVHERLADPSPEAAFSAYLRGLILTGLGVSAVVGAATWWRSRL